MQKSIPVILVILLFGFVSAEVQGQSTEELLGAIAGGALGSTIGDGDGRKAATVIGAIIGYRMGERVLNSEDRKKFLDLNDNDFYNYCRNEVPNHYRHRYNLRDMWIRGCKERLLIQQRQLEREAYEDGLNGPAN